MKNLRTAVVILGLRRLMAFYFIAGCFSTLILGCVPALALPEGRHWELVSPPDKHGVAIQAMVEGGGITQASESGNAITYIASGPPDAEPAGNRALEFSQILSTRGTTSWESDNITTPNSEASGIVIGDSSEYKLFSNDLSSGLVEPKGVTPLPPLAAGAEKTIYVRDDSNDSFQALVTAANVLPGRKFGEASSADVLHFDGSSPDVKHVVFSSIEALTSGAAKIKKGLNYLPNLYEWTANELQQVNILPGGEGANQVGYGSSLGLKNHIVRNAVSEDGSRVVWEARGRDPHTEEQATHLYIRDVDTKETLQLDLPNTGNGAGPATAWFRGASSDGSRIFFTDEQRLTSDSRAGEATGPDLYVFELSPGAGPLSGTLTDLTKDTGEGGGVPESADVIGSVIGYSNDGSYVYFVAVGELASGAASGAPNLYMGHFNGESWAVSLVATLSGEDNPDWGSNETAEGYTLPSMTARTSPSGRYLAFMSNRPLTGYDNHDANSSAADEEVYLYDSVSGRLVCASCNPSGARPLGVLDTGGGSFPVPLLVDGIETWIAPKGADPWLAGSIPGWTSAELQRAFYQPRYLLDSGQLFFDSPDSLVPGDVNGKEDVYEYRPAQSGVCDKTNEGTTESYKVESGGAGCVSLISSGTSTEESAFEDSSASGEDVFFLTSSRLTFQDIDESRDVYDAHECSAMTPCPAVVQMAPSQPCSEEASCRSSLTTSVPLGVPTSSTFSGSGNVGPSRGVVTVRKRLSPAQKLARALKACKKDRVRSSQVKCEAKAKREFRVEAKRARHRAAR